MSSIKINKKDKTYKEFESLAKKHNMSLVDFLNSDKHFDLVTDTFYKSLPKLMRMMYSREKFKNFYKLRKDTFIGMLVKAK